MLSFSSNANSIALYYRRAGETAREGFDLRRAGLELDWRDPNTRLVVLELPAGSYEFFRWRTYNRNPTEWFSVPFAVVPGRATYIGNLHVEIGQDGYWVETKDRMERDFPLLFARYPGLQKEYVDVTLAPVREERRDHAGSR